MLEYLRKNGADLSGTNAAGMTPAKCAIMHDQADVLRYLYTQDVDLPVSVMHNNLKTFAQENGAENCIIFLNEYESRIQAHTPCQLLTIAPTLFSINNKRFDSSGECGEAKRRCYRAANDD
jgi:hypothetical protein